MAPSPPPPSTRSREPAAIEPSARQDRSRSAAVWLATAGGLGFTPRAPGTAGAAGALLLFLVTARFGLLAHLAIVFAVTALGVWAAGASERAFGRSDDGRIVIDEVAGQLLALTPLFELPPAALHAPFADTAFPALLVTAFVAFRVFDIAKPGPVGWAERHFSGGVGVMVDDLVAGGLAALLVALVMAVGVAVLR